MKVKILREIGYEEAALGFSLSYNSTPERSKKIFPKYAFGIPGEGKFLESIILYVDIDAPRFWWQEMDTYRVGVTKNSESTVHTITRRLLNQDDFELNIPHQTLDILNSLISIYQTNDRIDVREDCFHRIKNMLPEGFLQRRIVMLSYKTLQNIYNQRKSHKLPQWKQFLESILSQIEHPEFIRKIEMENNIETA